jgi:hypothetical protein
MDILLRDDLKTLIEKENGPCVSLFIPMERAGKETRQNPIRLKNAIRDAESRLATYGVSPEDAHTIVKPVQELQEDHLFWEQQSDGLAIFCTQDMFRTYRLPMNFDDMVVVSNRFHVKPLLSLFVGNGSFYILALSQKKVRIFQATRYSVTEWEWPEEVPGSIEEALGYDDPEKQLQFHTNVPRGGSGDGQAPVFHGQGTPKDQHLPNLMRYLMEIDRGVQKLLNKDRAPLVLAGVEYLHPLYHETTSYPNVMQQGVDGNPDILKPEELHAQAWKVVEPYFAQEQQTAHERYNELVEKGQASNDLETIIPSAIYGRIETLFVSPDIQQWGSFDHQTNTVHIDQHPRPGNEDLLDLAAVYTLSNSGNVYVVNREHVPDKALAAAVFRY